MSPAGSAAEYARVFDALPHGVVLHDADGVIVAANPAAARIIGLPVAELLGTVTSDPRWGVIRESGAPFPGADHPSSIALRTGRAVDAVVMGVTHQSTGELRWISVTATPFFRDGASAPFQVMSSFEDISERRQSAAALRASEDRFERAFREGPVMMAISDLETGRYYDVNTRYCDVSGYRRDQLLGRSSIEVGVITPEGRAIVREKMRSEGRVTNLEVPLRTAAGKDIVVLMSGEILDLDGTPCLLTIATDITDMKRMETERVLLEAQVQHLRRMESIGRLAGGVAHDMNNVLTAILTLAELQSQDAEHGSPLHEDMETIAASALRGQSTVRGLLRFARSEVSPMELVDLNALIRDEVALLARTTLQRAVLSTDLDEALPRVRGDRTALTHVFMNLCLNAVDAMPDGGTVTVRTRRDGTAHLVAEVVDSGTGMPEEVLEKALDPFFTTKPQGRGTGLGLSIVYGTVQAHGGTMKLRSKPGEGTTVRIRLPVAHEVPALE